MKSRPFAEAREFVHTLGLRSQSQWREFIKSGKKPSDIPSNAPRTYKKEWKGWGDFLGTGTIAPSDRQFIPFPAAREFVHRLKLKSLTEWIRYCKSNKRPIDIPSNPNQVYKKDWVSWGHWLGTENVAPKDREYYPFEQVKDHVHPLKLKSQSEWYKYIKSGQKPPDIPADPSKAYKKEWKGWGDFLGTGTIAPFNREFRPFKEAREFAHSLQLKGWEEWEGYCKSKRRPIDIPSDPPRVYKDEWKGWPDWLGYEEKLWSVKSKRINT